MTAGQQGRQKRRWLTADSSIDTLRTQPDRLDPNQSSKHLAHSDDTREFVCKWLEFMGFKSKNSGPTPTIEQIKAFAESINRDANHVFRLVLEETRNGAQPLALLTSTEARSSKNATSMSTTRLALELHLREATQKSCNSLQRRKRKLVGSYQCTSKSCNYRTNTRESWHRHMDHRQPRIVYVCASCPAGGPELPFTEHRKDKFREHVKQAHTRVSSTILHIEEKSSNPQKPTESLRCGFCGQRFTSHKEYRDHVLEHFDRKKSGGEEWDVRIDWQDFPGIAQLNGGDGTVTERAP